jgi:RHS repeat-associated protein
MDALRKEARTLRGQTLTRMLLALALVAFWSVAPLMAGGRTGLPAYRVTMVLYPGDDGTAVAKRLAAMYRGTLETGVDGDGSFVIVLSDSGANLMRRDPAVARLEVAAPDRGPASTAVAAAWKLGDYLYDGSGNVRKIGTEFFAYDTDHRLVVSAETGQAPAVTHEQTYAYDSFGNLTAITTAGAGQTTLGVNTATNGLSTVTAAGGASVSPQYDDAGNMVGYGTATYAYDALNRMTKSVVDGATRHYAYSPSDERIATFEGTAGGTRSDWTIRDQAGQVLRRYSRETTGEWKWHEDYIYRGSQMLAAEVLDTARTRHFHLDHLGTPRLITGNGGAELSRYNYHPFGVEIAATSTSATGAAREKKQFTGHERDAESLDYMHARFYAPYMGRFLSVDPNAFWELQGGSEENRAKFRSYLRHPQRWNRYAYVSNNPINKIDPDGREENFYMEQLFREQQMVGEGKMTEDQYWARRRSEGYGAWIGTAGAGGWLLGARAVSMGITAYQTWRTASAAAAAIKIIEQTSRGDARVFQTAMNFARGTGNTFMNNLTALSRAVEQVVGPQGRITQIGQIGDQAVWGSARTGYGITVINGVTKIVQMIGDNKYRIIGNFR